MKTATLAARAASAGLRALAALLVGAAAWTSPARACTRPWYGLNHVSATVPVDGVVAISWTCAGVCAADAIPDDLHVTNHDTGQSVTGTLVVREVDAQGSAWAAFKPSQPFTAGQTYDVGALGAAPFMQPPFTAVARLDFDPTALQASARVVDRYDDSGIQICCERARPDPCGGRTSCFTKQLLHLAEATVAWELSTPGVDQWLYAVTWKPTGLAPSTDKSRPGGTVHEFDVAADQYCYEVEATRINDGKKVTGPSGCIQNTIVGLGLQANPSEDYLPIIASCAEPPIGYQTEWCETVGARCNAIPDDSPESCARRDALCGARPQEPIKEAAGDAGMVATTAAGSGALAAHDAKGALEPVRSGGCSLGIGSASGMDTLAWLGLTLGVLSRRRRTRGAV